MMRLAKPLLPWVAAFFMSGCVTLDFLTDNCREEWISVSWPATITRGNATAVHSLTGTVSPGNIDRDQFELLKDVLVTGGREPLTNVVWTVPAFDVNGGYIALMHPAPLSTGQREPLSLAWDGGGWGVPAAGRLFAPSIAVRAENFRATTAAGSITAISGIPLRLRVDVLTRDEFGETIRITGDAQFSYEEARSSCS